MALALNEPRSLIYIYSQIKKKKKKRIWSESDTFLFLNFVYLFTLSVIVKKERNLSQYLSLLFGLVEPKISRDK